MIERIYPNYVFVYHFFFSAKNRVFFGVFPIWENLAKRARYLRQSAKPTVHCEHFMSAMEQSKIYSLETNTNLTTPQKWPLRTHKLIRSQGKFNVCLTTMCKFSVSWHRGLHGVVQPRWRRHYTVVVRKLSQFRAQSCSLPHICVPFRYFSRWTLFHGHFVNPKRSLLYFITIRDWVSAHIHDTPCNGKKSYCSPIVIRKWGLTLRIFFSKPRDKAEK